MALTEMERTCTKRGFMCECVCERERKKIARVLNSLLEIPMPFGHPRCQRSSCLYEFGTYRRGWSENINLGVFGMSISEITENIERDLHMAWS